MDVWRGRRAQIDRGSTANARTRPSSSCRATSSRSTQASVFPTGESPSSPSQLRDADAWYRQIDSGRRGTNNAGAPRVAPRTLLEDGASRRRDHHQDGQLSVPTPGATAHHGPALCQLKTCLQLIVDRDVRCGRAEVRGAPMVDWACNTKHGSPSWLRGRYRLNRHPFESLI